MHLNLIEMKYIVFCVTLNLLFFASIVSSTVDVTASYDDSATSSKQYEVKHKLTLSCNVSSSENGTELHWEKDGKLVSTIDTLKTRAKMVQDKHVYTFTIPSSTEEDAGNYSCVVTIKDQEVKRANIIAASKIYVKTQDSINVVEGEKLRIVCQVAGNPPPELYWTVGNETYHESRGRIILQDGNDRKINNSVLVIESVTMDDRGEFTCHANSNVPVPEPIQHTSMIRIKDKYAALWPFIGICAEVIVLCAIILIYEKKRNKTELEESDTDQSPEQKNTPDLGEKESNLRHRQ